MRFGENEFKTGQCAILRWNVPAGEEAGGGEHEGAFRGNPSPRCGGRRAAAPAGSGRKRTRCAGRMAKDGST